MEVSIIEICKGRSIGVIKGANELAVVVGDAEDDFVIQYDELLGLIKFDSLNSVICTIQQLTFLKERMEKGVKDDE